MPPNGSRTFRLRALLGEITEEGFEIAAAKFVASVSPPAMSSVSPALLAWRATLTPTATAGPPLAGRTRCSRRGCGRRNRLLRCFGVDVGLDDETLDSSEKAALLGQDVIGQLPPLDTEGFCRLP